MAIALLGASLLPMAASGACPAFVGDVSGDAALTVVDVQCSILGALWGIVPNSETVPACAIGPAWLDVSCDGAIDIVDVTMVVQRALGASFAPEIDANGDLCPDACVAVMAANPYTPSVAHIWNEVLLDAIRVDLPRPTVHARNLFHLSMAMWDAWVAWDDVGEPWLVPEEGPAVADVQAAREEAISYAAYRLLKHRFQSSVGASKSLPNIEATMAALGYDGAITTTVGDSPAAIGNRIAATVIAFGLQDGSNEQNAYKDITGYSPVNPPLVVDFPGATMINPNRWQTLALDVFVTQNGIELGPTPSFIGPHWGEIVSFCLFKPSPTDCHLDPGPPPYLGGVGDQEFKDANVEVIRYSSYLDPDDGVLMDISPAGKGNNPLGLNTGTGYPLNPWTGQPYTPQIVKRGDWTRVIAEFWADGPQSETPPGHWNTVANHVSEDPLLIRRINGRGPVLDPLEWDVKLYLTLNGALHDAAVAAWDVKSYYDYVRPVSSVRYLAGKGQSSDPSAPSYHPQGLPLVPGLVEVITKDTTKPGQRHAHLKGGEGFIAIYAWGGTPEDPESQYTGAKWMYGVLWMPYQRPTFVTPPFAGYVSGHSTFSRSAAEVLSRFTGSPYLPGGIGGFPIPENDHLAFEVGPTESMDLQWATYYDAADESGISRIYGGIHVRADDKNGRMIGAQIGKTAYAEGMKFIHGAP